MPKKKEVVNNIVKNKPIIGIVDDHIQIAVSVCNRLENEGFKTFQIYSGDDAEEATKKNNPDILIVDVNVDRGGINGYQVAEKLPKTKILFSTGSGYDEKRVSKMKNIIGIIEKPYDTTKLLPILRKELKIPEINN